MRVARESDYVDEGSGSVSSVSRFLIDSMMFIGSGKTMVDDFSPAISVKVCRYRSCMEFDWLARR